MLSALAAGSHPNVPRTRLRTAGFKDGNHRRLARAAGVRQADVRRDLPGNDRDSTRCGPCKNHDIMC